jgi:hypothetical protein
MEGTTMSSLRAGIIVNMLVSRKCLMLSCWQYVENCKSPYSCCIVHDWTTTAGVELRSSIHQQQTIYLSKPEIHDYQKIYPPRYMIAKKYIHQVHYYPEIYPYILDAQLGKNPIYILISFSTILRGFINT